MKISELIKKLQEIQEEHGNIETYYDGAFYHGDFDEELFNEVFCYKEFGMLYIG